MPVDFPRIPTPLVVATSALVFFVTAIFFDLSGASGIAAGVLATLGILLAAKSAAEPDRSDGLLVRLFATIVVAAPFALAAFFVVTPTAFAVHVLCGSAVFLHAHLQPQKNVAWRQEARRKS